MWDYYLEDDISSKEYKDIRSFQNVGWSNVEVDTLEEAKMKAHEDHLRKWSEDGRPHQRNIIQVTYVKYNNNDEIMEFIDDVIDFRC